jgi:hypothetical protein
MSASPSGAARRGPTGHADTCRAQREALDEGRVRVDNASDFGHCTGEGNPDEQAATRVRPPGLGERSSKPIPTGLSGLPLGVEQTIDPWMDAAHRGILPPELQEQIQEEAGNGGQPGAAHGEEDAAHEQPLTERARSLPPEILAAQALESGMAGVPVELPYRGEIEAQLGRPLGRVRCFTGKEACQACEAVGARAFVVADVMILAEPRPPFEVVLHEAIHFAQQAGSSIGTRPPASIAMGSVGDAHEQQAHAVADGIARGDTSERLGAGASAIASTSPRLSGIFYLPGCSNESSSTQGGSSTVNTGPKGVSNADGDGWLRVQIGGGVNSLPWYLKVNHTRRANNRDEFEVLEGSYQGHQRGSVVAKSATESHLESGLSYRGAAAVTLRKGARQLTYGGTTISAFTDEVNPIPSGRHQIQIPDAPHHGGTSYGSFATTWFRLGTSGDRYLHAGRVSLGCATVNDISAWPALYRHLINSRQSTTAVGTLTVMD